MEVMPFSDDVGECGETAQDLAETLTEAGTGKAVSVGAHQSVRTFRQSAIDATTAEMITRFVADDWGRVVGAVEYVCGPDVDAPAAVAEALARLVETLTRGRAIHNLTAWVTQVAINVGRSELRHFGVKRRKLPSLISRESGADSAESVIEALDLQRAMAGLPKRQAQVVALRYGLDLSIADIAETLGISEGGTKAALSKARNNLAGALTLDEGVENDE